MPRNLRLEIIAAIIKGKLNQEIFIEKDKKPRLHVTLGVLNYVRTQLKVFGLDLAVKKILWLLVQCAAKGAYASINSYRRKP